MATPGGTITQKDLFSDDAFKFGDPMVKEFEKVIAAQKKMADGAKELALVVNTYRKVETNQQFIDNKNAEKLATEKVILGIKEEESALISIEKVKQESLRTDKLVSDAKKREQKEQQGSIKLTIEERVQNEINNKILKQEALDRLGLLSAYTKLNNARTDAKNKLRDLIATEGASTAEIKKAQKEFDVLASKVKKADDAVNDFTKNVGNYPQIGKLASNLKDLIGAFGLVGGLGAFASVMQDSFKTIKQFNQSLADLSAITGATGVDLDFLKDKAIELGKSTKGGASAVLEAYKLIGSAKPELLSNVEALNQVTEATILLSKAAGLELPDAATALTDAMNQFGADASQASKFVDTLAAGAKYGAAEIPQVTDALLKFGAVARTSNVNIQESTALVELLAENGLKGAEAGTALRNVMLKLSAPDALPKEAQSAINKLGISFSDLSDKSKPIQERLEKLKPLLKDNAGMIKVFGVENVVAATNILGHTERLSELTKQVDENGVAQEQATVRSNTLQGATERLSNAWDSYILSQSEATNTTGFFTKTISYLGDNLGDIIDTIVKLGTVYLVYLATTKAVTFATEAYRATKVFLTAAEFAFTTATGIGTAATKAKVLATQQAIASESARTAEQVTAILVTQGFTLAEAEAVIATNALNVATKATPWGMIIGLLLASTAAYAAFSDSMSDAQKSMKKLKEESKRYKDQEDTTNKSSDDFRLKRFKQIEDEINLRKKQGEDSKKLDDEEIDRKRNLLIDELETYGTTHDMQIEDTRTKVSESNKRIAQMKKEQALGSTTGRRNDELQQLIDSENEKQKTRVNFLEVNKKVSIAEKTKLNNLLNELNKKSAEDEAEVQMELTKKQIAAAKKAREEYLKNLKEKDKSEFELGQFRLHRAKELNQDILDDEKKSINERIEAYLNGNQLDITILENLTAQKLKEISRYDDKIRDLTDNQIQQLLLVSDAEREALYKKLKLTDDEILVLEQMQAKKEDINKKILKNYQDLIDKEVAQLQKKIDAELLSQETKLNQALEAENKLYLAILKSQKDKEEAQKEHERKILEIKKYFSKQGVDAQIKAIEDLLKAQDKIPEKERISSKLRSEYDNKLAKLKKENSDLEVENSGTNTKKILFFEEEKFKKIEDLSKQLKDALVSLSNAIFESRISNIDGELQKNDIYYAKQLELAGNDQRKKDLIQKEAEKKREELEKKKRAEQYKQAVFNKAMAIVDAGINTAKAVTSALSAGPGVGLALAVITAAVAAVQLAAIVATPIPKYKDGRIGGKKEIAIVGDGGRHEIIERSSGLIEMTPRKDTLVQLLEGDTVHRSVEDYQRYLRASILSNVAVKNGKMNDYQAGIMFDIHNKELLNELKKNTRAIEKNKTSVNVNMPKIDIPHSIWKSKNTNWN